LLESVEPGHDTTEVQLTSSRGGTMRADCRPDDAMRDAVVVTLDGLFDEAGAVTVWQEVTPSLDSATPFLLVDLAGVNRITSAGVGALVRLLHRVRGLGGGIAVFGAGTRVRQVIEAVRLDQLLNLGTSIGDARERLRPR
jgi:anti-anti-sigma factor